MRSLWLLVLCSVACAFAQNAATGQTGGARPAGILDLKTAQSHFGSVQRSMQRAVSNLESLRRLRWRHEKTLNDLQAELKQAQDAKTTAEAATSAAKTAVGTAEQAVTTHESTVIAPLDKSVKEQQQQHSSKWAPELAKVELSKQQLSNWPVALASSAQKRLENYRLSLQSKVDKMNADKQNLQQQQSRLATLKVVQDKAVKLHESRVQHVKDINTRITQTQVKIDAEKTKLATLDQKIENARKAANHIEQQLGQAATALQVALDWAMKAEAAEVAAALKAETEAHQAVVKARRHVDRVRNKKHRVKGDIDYLKAKLHKARENHHNARQRHQTAQSKRDRASQRNYEMKVMVRRAQQTLEDFKAQFGPVVSPSGGATPTAVPKKQDSNPTTAPAPAVTTAPTTAPKPTTKPAL